MKISFATRFWRAALVLLSLAASAVATAQTPDEIDFDDDSLSVAAAIPSEKEAGLRLVAKVPHGVLAKLDGVRDVLILEGSPEEMGRAHGELMKKGIVAMRERIYAAGAAASLAQKVDFFAQTDEAVRRTRPFSPERFFRELDALAESAGLSRVDAERLNHFPELFHCSGVAARGRATKDGRALHVRVLDYARDIGLQENSAIIVYKPTGYRAWASVSYAGFVGTVTAMNEKGLTIGEMGGGGEGKWDGLPMAFLMRRVVEECDTVEEAINLMKSVPLTCDYYYCLSDARGAVAAVAAIAESENPVEVLEPGVKHPQLPGALEDLVFISAGSRADALFQRLKENYGKLEPEMMRELVKRPVAMNSNLHDAIFRRKRSICGTRKPARRRPLATSRTSI